MRRADIQARIAELDKRINEELATTKLPDSSKRVHFPVGALVMAALAFGWYFMGNEYDVTRPMYQKTYTYAPYVGGFMILLAVIGVIRWLIQPKALVGEKYRETAARVKTMQEERRELMAQLKDAAE